MNNPRRFPLRMIHLAPLALACVLPLAQNTLHADGGFCNIQSLEDCETCCDGSVHDPTYCYAVCANADNACPGEFPYQFDPDSYLVYCFC
jgi:hypothetical protein